MFLYHNSQEINFRSPFGAVKAGTTITLGLHAESEAEIDSAHVRLWFEKREHLIPMSISQTGKAEYFCTAKITLPETPCIVWYYFFVQCENKTYYYSNNAEQLGGTGIFSDSTPTNSYQITVYDKSFKAPDWFKNTIIYQIFPDRFFREDNFPNIQKKRPEYTIHEDWYDPLAFNKHPHEEGPACNDFYGGNLKGIIAKLDYLKDLGIGAIYLNPIFEAYSNHRYDTADYSKIDPMLGNEDDFIELCKQCDARNIRIILDGVFSHTGSDSIYFNKYKNYGENTGAYQNPSSPYYPWYQWEDGNYKSWWGCSNLPNINETEPTYIDYILTGEHAIIKKWLRLGAFGWRLDVADELPDEFIKILRAEAKSVKSDAVIIGEVWEDASYKTSYGKMREYFLGHELDGVMNYPFRDCVLGFILGNIDARHFQKIFMSLVENYPSEALYSSMNLIGTHDTIRAKTYLSETPDESASLSSKEETLASARVKIAMFFQMTFPGVPCIYYGDEIGMHGISDPFNRMPFSWRCADIDLLYYCKKLTSIRNSTDCLRCGDFRFAYANNHILAYWRRVENNIDMFGNPAENGEFLCVINRSNEKCEFEVCYDKQKSLSFTALLKQGTAFLDGTSIIISIPGNCAEIFKIQ